MPNSDPHFGSSYKFGAINDPIELDQETLALATEYQWTLGTGKAFVRFLPRPSLEIEGTFPAINTFLDSRLEMQLGMPDRGLEVPGFRTSLTGAVLGPGNAKLEWVVTPEPLTVIGHQDTQVSRALFHIFNFRDLLSKKITTERVDGSIKKINHFMLEWGEFVIHIRSLSSTPALIKSLSAQGGFAVTHLGEITHKAGKSMSVKEIEEVLEGLRLFLSFVRGAWASPILPIGYDTSGAVVWQRWDSPHGDPFLYTRSWLDSLHGTEMETLFPNFMGLCTDAGWRDAISEAIYWYVNSNCSSRGIDAGIILTQTAIERLCFAHSVENGGFLSLDGFSRLPASDRFRLLFAALRIPQDIPSTLSELSKLAKEHSWIDAPQALTEMRNEKVHPQHKKRGLFNAALYDAWTFGLWYVEMALLRLCNYSGPYASRLKSPRSVGDVDKVPWAN